MKVIYCKHFPIKGFFAINICGLCIVRSEYKSIMERNGFIAKKVLNHEGIHTLQMKETLYIGFYLFYLINWLWNLIICPKTAYESISFEQEAYANDYNLNYKDERKHFSWMKYIFKKLK